MYKEETFNTLLDSGGHKDVNGSKFSKFTHTGKMSMPINCDQMLARTCSNGNSPLLLVNMKNGTVTFGRQFGGFLQN